MKKSFLGLTLAFGILSAHGHIFSHHSKSYHHNQKNNNSIICDKQDNCYNQYHTNKQDSIYHHNIDYSQHHNNQHHIRY